MFTQTYPSIDNSKWPRQLNPTCDYITHCLAWGQCLSCRQLLHNLLKTKQPIDGKHEYPDMIINVWEPYLKRPFVWPSSFLINALYAWQVVLGSWTTKNVYTHFQVCCIFHFNEFYLTSNEDFILTWKTCTR